MIASFFSSVDVVPAFLQPADHPDEISGGAGADFDFAWDKPFEMVVLMVVHDVYPDLKNSAHYNRRRVPLRLSWKQGPSKMGRPDGPSCSTPFHYVAYWVGDSHPLRNERGIYWGQARMLGDAERPDHDAIDSPDIREIVDTYVTSGFLELNTTEGSLYAGHFRFNHESPDGVWVDGLRPFGAVKETDSSVHYR